MFLISSSKLFVLEVSEKRLVKNVKVNSQISHVTDRTTITTQILHNISRRQAGNEIWPVNGTCGIFLFKNYAENKAGRLFPELFV